MSRADHECGDPHWRGIVANIDDARLRRSAARPATAPEDKGHFSALGLTGLRLDLAASTVNGLAARCLHEPSLIGEYEQRLGELEHYRDAFAAELERLTGLPASLIARRLTL